ncbi:MAG: hypothetical protein LC734_05085 [Acidobacteria bacterium]|nr:hypothetical protein [Acidobacteriota bacterium]
MNIAKIVNSNSHIAYVARVIDSLDSETPPDTTDYGFGQFVGIELEPDTAIGVIYDSKLINPEYASFGPRLSPRPALGSFSPDFLNEQGILIAILLLGTIGKDGRAIHGVPRRIVPAGHEVSKLNREIMRQFHIGADGRLHIRYYSQIVSHAGAFAVPLLDLIIDELCTDCDADDRERLEVLKSALAWQGTMGSMKL